MFCKECATENESDAKFCTQCGNGLTDEKETQQDSSHPIFNTKPIKKADTSIRHFLIYLLVLYTFLFFFYPSINVYDNAFANTFMIFLFILAIPSLILLFVAAIKYFTKGKVDRPRLSILIIAFIISILSTLGSLD